MIVETLKRDIEEYAARMQRAHPLMEKARAGALPPEALSAYVSNVRYSILNIYQHLQMAHRRASELGQADLAEYYAHKCDEEYGHDRWADEDLERLRADFSAAPSPPSESVSDLMDYLRVVIERDPRCYLAYALFAEYLTVLAGPEFLSAVETGCGIPQSHLSVIAHHVEVDRHHVAEGLAEMEVLTVGADEQALVETLHRSMESFERFCDEISQMAA